MVTGVAALGLIPRERAVPTAGGGVFWTARVVTVTVVTVVMGLAPAAFPVGTIGLEMIVTVGVLELIGT
jgi:uncharacterized membrane protein